jgi:hypothetical protein
LVCRQSASRSREMAANRTAPEEFVEGVAMRLAQAVDTLALVNLQRTR